MKKVRRRKTKLINHILTYVESRKMVQMNLFPGRNRDAVVENGHVDTAGKGSVGQTGRLGLTYIHSEV